MGKKKWLLVLLALLCLYLACCVAEAEECSHAYGWHWGYNETEDWEVCNNCGEEIEGTRGPHHAYCDTPDVCTSCGIPYAGSDIWHRSTHVEHNTVAHWWVCDFCGKMTWSGRESHFALCDEPNVCGACGVPYTGSNIRHLGEHIEYNEKEHWWVCESCGEITVSAWEHYAYCDLPDVCDYCGASYTGSDIRHRETITEYDENTHWKICIYCEQTVLGPEEHYAYSWVDPDNCYVCGAPISGQTATPTASPTPTPTASPTPTPTATPTASPTPTPTATPVPTATEVPVPKATWDAESGKLVTANYPTYTGFVDFEGGKFYIENGQQKTDYVGPVQIDGTFYAFDKGRLQTENMMMAFEGGLFAFNGGTLRTDLIGLAAYNGEQFVFDHGQYQHDACGPYLDPISGKWVYVNYGQFYPITDLVSYDGEIFYFVDGFLATGFTGIVYDFNGTGFYIASGQHYKITDLVSCDGEVLYVVDGKFASWYTGAVKDFMGTELNVVNGKVAQ